MHRRTTRALAGLSLLASLPTCSLALDLGSLDEATDQGTGGGGAAQGGSGQGGTSGGGGVASGGGDAGGGGAGGQGGAPTAVDAGDGGPADDAGDAGPAIAWELFATTSTKPRGLAADLGAIYWAEPDALQLWRKPLAGGAGQSLATVDQPPQEIALLGAYVVWLGPPHVWATKLDGSHTDTVRYHDGVALRALASRPEEGAVYWAEDASIWRCTSFEQSACNGGDAFAPVTFGPVRLLARSSASLYFVSDGDVIRRVDPPSQDVGSFHVGAEAADVRQLSVSAAHVHWVSSAGCFRKPELAGAAVEELAPGPFVAHHVTSAAAYALAASGQVYRYAPDAAASLAPLGSPLPGAASIVAAKGYVYATVPDAGEIWRRAAP